MHILYIPSNFFLVALGALNWKIFLSEREREIERERERERERKRVSKRECIYARKFNGNGKWLNSKTQNIPIEQLKTLFC